MKQISEKELWNILHDCSTNTPDDFCFLEQSREREIAYTKRSIIRWHEIIEKILHHGRCESCLDIGTSSLTFALPKIFDNVSTLDYGDGMKPRCERAGISFQGGGIRGEDLPYPDESFDCILFLEVIEHLHLNPISLLNRIKSKLKKGGMLLLSTPNMMCFGNRLKMLLNKKLGHFAYPPFANNEFPEHGNNHDRVFMPAELSQYFTETGWSSFDVGYHGLRVADLPQGSLLKSIIYSLPVALKLAMPSLRQLILVKAVK